MTEAKTDIRYRLREQAKKTFGRYGGVNSLEHEAAIEISSLIVALDEANFEIGLLKTALSEVCKPLPLGMLWDEDKELALREVNRRMDLARKALG